MHKICQKTCLAIKELYSDFLHFRVFQSEKMVATFEEIVVTLARALAIGSYISLHSVRMYDKREDENGARESYLYTSGRTEDIRQRSAIDNYQPIAILLKQQ